MMPRNFGIQSGRASLGGASTDTSATRDAIIPRGSNSFTRALPPDALVNLRGGKTVSSFIQPSDREFAAKCFVAGLVSVIGFVLFVSWFVISNFVA